MVLHDGTILRYCYDSGICWFRIFGYGLMWKDVRSHPILFSERYGYRKGFQVKHWRINVFAPDKPLH
jgi:hypothetical protein